MNRTVSGSFLFMISSLFSCTTGQCDEKFQSDLLSCLHVQSLVTVYSGATTRFNEYMSGASESHQDLGIPGVLAIEHVSVTPSSAPPVPEGRGDPMSSTGAHPTITAVKSMPEGSVSPDGGGLSSAAVAGIIIGLLLLLFIAAIIVIRRRRRRATPSSDHELQDDPDKDEDETEMWEEDVPLFVEIDDGEVEIQVQ